MDGKGIDIADATRNLIASLSVWSNDCGRVSIQRLHVPVQPQVTTAARNHFFLALSTWRRKSTIVSQLTAEHFVTPRTSITTVQRCFPNPSMPNSQLCHPSWINNKGVPFTLDKTSFSTPDSHGLLYTSQMSSHGRAIQGICWSGGNNEFDTTNPKLLKYSYKCGRIMVWAGISLWSHWPVSV